MIPTTPRIFNNEGFAAKHGGLMFEYTVSHTLNKVEIHKVIQVVHLRRIL